MIEQTRARSQSTFVLGLYDHDSPLSILRGYEACLVKIFEYIDEWYRDHVTTDSTAYRMFERPVLFPRSTGLNINMMPVKSSRYGNFWKTLPEFCFQYNDLLVACMMEYGCDDWQNQTIYVTINEGVVEQGTTQRRGGLHIERPCRPALGNITTPGDDDYPMQRFGLGEWCIDRPKNGIVMVSNVDETCQVWPCLIKNSHEVTDKHGGIENMRRDIGESTLLKANQLCWFTDITPHESVAMKKTQHRSFFRVVVGPMSEWHSKHCTANPDGTLPDCTIVDDDKFVE